MRGLFSYLWAVLTTLFIVFLVLLVMSYVYVIPELTGLFQVVLLVYISVYFIAKLLFYLTHNKPLSYEKIEWLAAHSDYRATDIIDEMDITARINYYWQKQYLKRTKWWKLVLHPTTQYLIITMPICGAFADGYSHITNNHPEIYKGLPLISFLFVFLYLGVIVTCHDRLFSALRANRYREAYANIALDRIDMMRGIDFEHYCAWLLGRLGFRDVHVTPGSGDQGVDILAKYGEDKYAVQCKRVASKLGNTPVQEVYTGAKIYNCNKALVVTNSYYTKGAQEAAASTGVILWDRTTLEHYIKEVS